MSWVSRTEAAWCRTSPRGRLAQTAAQEVTAATACTWSMHTEHLSLLRV